jgi:hypothetical protein
MKVKVRLFGTLGKKFPDHDPLNGFEIEIPEEAIPCRAVWSRLAKH